MATTTTVTELPDKRHWLGRDWIKLVVAGALALSLIRLAPAQPAIVSPPRPSTAGPPTVPVVQSGLAAPTLDPPGAGLRAGPITLGGTAAPNTTVRVMLNGTDAGMATVGPDRRWALDATLPAGEVVIVVESISGAQTAAGRPLQMRVGAATEPGAAAKLAIAAPTIALAGAAPRAGSYSLRGGGTPGSALRVTVNGTDAGMATVGADGRWALEVVLPAGEVTMVAAALDEAGTLVAASAPARLSVAAGDSTVASSPSAPPAVLGAGTLAIGVPQEGAQLPPGPLELSGSGRPGSRVEVLNSDQVVAEATIGDDGIWRATAELAEGTAAISVREQGSDQIAARPIRVTIGQAEQISCTDLAAGCKAFVTRAGGLVLRMRDAPTTAGAVVARLPIGTELELQAGPTTANGLRWWRVRTLGGSTGWVAGENLLLQPD